ncbi:DUF1622 domain-containing protein [Parvularcula maris]|uniref:DUF1622 domain-containing protein n=1 Tax=Parvularcula maris TaxID=2965077 RepID=A0A9X2L6C4_9PROT|nr:DUF1622 domain-containing protein [Parvularcula maris]MCQ8183880.1 DUF1622 domain-containing protein [Parvularcula maris]
MLEEAEAFAAFLFQAAGFVIEAIAALLLISGAALFLWTILNRGVMGKRRVSSAFAEARLRLGTYILAGLEFMIVADILFTIVNRTLEDVIVLAIVVAVRTLISFFLNRELEELQMDAEPSEEGAAA